MPSRSLLDLEFHRDRSGQKLAECRLHMPDEPLPIHLSRYVSPSGAFEDTGLSIVCWPRGYASHSFPATSASRIFAAITCYEASLMPSCLATSTKPSSSSLTQISTHFLASSYSCDPSSQSSSLFLSTYTVLNPHFLAACKSPR